MHKSSYCGINCEKCKVYIASAAKDDSLKAKVAEEWGALYKRDFTEDDILCEGCKSDTVFCLCSLCDIRPCNQGRRVTNCADCAGFPCERINRFFDFHKKYDTGNVFN